LHEAEARDQRLEARTSIRRELLVTSKLVPLTSYLSHEAAARDQRLEARALLTRISKLTYFLPLLPEARDQSFNKTRTSS
jgi:hypothetical protein